MKHFLLLIALLMAYHSNAQKVNTPYSYPVRPGTAAWEQLAGYEARLQAYNVPDELLQNMTTEALVKTCLAYPEWRLLQTRNNPQEGYLYLKSIFNGFEALEKREDAAFELLKIYRNVHPASITQQRTSADKGKFSFDLLYLELLLAQYPILIKSNPSLRNEIMREAHKMYGEQESLPEYYGVYSLSVTALAPARIMSLDKAAERRQDTSSSTRFIQTGLSDIQTIRAVMNESKGRIK